MVGVHNDHITWETGSKLLNRIYGRKQVLFGGGIILLSLIQCSTG